MASTTSGKTANKPSIKGATKVIEETTVPTPGADLNIDFGLDPQEAIESVQKGTEKGVLQGFKNGAAAEVQPLAEKAAAAAMRTLANGGDNTALDTTLNAVAKATQLKVMNSLSRSLDTPQPPPQQQAQPPPVEKTMVQKAKELNEAITALGMDPAEFMKDMSSWEKFMLLQNPDMLPLMMDSREKKTDSGSFEQKLEMMRMYRQQQNPQQPSDMATILQIMLAQQKQTTDMFMMMMQQQQQQAQQQQAQFQQQLAMQQANSDEKMQMQLKFLQPFMQHRSFAEEIGELGEKMEGLKTLGLGPGAGGAQRSQQEALLDFEAKKMGMDIKKQEILMEKEDRIEKRKMDREDRTLETIGKAMGLAQRAFKSMDLTEKQPPPPDQSPPSEQPQEKKTRVMDLMRKAAQGIQKAIPDPPPEQEGSA